MNKVELQNLVGGAVQEKFAKSFERVVENLQDQNTSFKVKRGITIKLDFTQNEDRDDVQVTVDVVEKLAPQSGMKTSFYIGKDLQTGEVFAEEYGKQIKGQMHINEIQKTEVIDGQKVDTATGEIIPETKKSEVVDFRTAKAL